MVRLGQFSTMVEWHSIAQHSVARHSAAPLMGLAMSTISPQDWSTAVLEPASLPDVPIVVTDAMGLKA